MSHNIHSTEVCITAVHMLHEKNIYYIINILGLSKSGKLIFNFFYADG